MKKREDIIRDVIIGIIAGTIIALLTCCADKPVKSAEELKAEYLKKEQEEKAIRQEKERIRRGELTYKEAIERIYEKNRYVHYFSDVFRFYDEGHYYKCFLTVSDQNTQYPHSSSGIVHDLNCPCKQNK
jgi:hypothetical protein